MLTNAELLAMTCQPTVGALDTNQVPALLQVVDGWCLEVPGAGDIAGHDRIMRAFGFKDYYATLAFVNAIAYVVHAEDHHPELTVTYDRCIVRFDTHSVNSGSGGLSINDFICAAKIDVIFRQSFS